MQQNEAEIQGKIDELEQIDGTEEIEVTIVAGAVKSITNPIENQ